MEEPENLLQSDKKCSTVGSYFNDKQNYVSSLIFSTINDETRKDHDDNLV